MARTRPLHPRPTGPTRTLVLGTASILAVGVGIGLVAEVSTAAEPEVVPVGTVQSPQQVRDTQTKQSLVTVSQAVETYYVSGSGALALDQEQDRAVLSTDGRVVTDVELAAGTRVHAFRAADYSTWCIAAANEDGTGQVFRMSADEGIAEGGCAPAEAAG